MGSVSSPRRTAGLLAAAAVGLSSALVGVAGPAQAEPSMYGSHQSDTGATTTIIVDEGTCTMRWTLVGGKGGATADLTEQAAAAPQRVVTTTVTEGETFTLSAGQSAGRPPNTQNWQGGANLVGGGAYDGADGDEQQGGGGGGAASVVLKDGAPYLGVAGGAGAGTGAGAGGTAPADNAPIVPGTDSLGVVTNGLVIGSVIAEGFPCPDAPPAAPSISTQAGPGKATVWVSPPASGPGISPVTGYEYRLDGGAWTPVTTTAVPVNMQQFVLTGLVDGRTYRVSVRATSAAGTGPASVDQQVVPFTAPSAPTGVAVTEGPASLTVSWSAPTAAGTYPLTRYEVTARNADGSFELDEPICRTDAAARTCTAAVPAGVGYVVEVVARDQHGHYGQGAGVRSGVVPFAAPSATVPAKDADLVGADGPLGKVVAGKTVVIKGSGFAPDSTVRAAIYSTPTELGTFMTDGNGAFEISVTVPEGLAAGEHTMVVSGVDRDGNVRNVLATVTVDAAGTATLTRASGSSAATASLASTGFSLALPLTVGLVTLGTGGGLLVASRRRATA